MWQLAVDTLPLHEGAVHTVDPRQCVREEEGVRGHMLPDSVHMTSYRKGSACRQNTDRVPGSGGEGVHGGVFWVMSCCVFLWWLHGCEQLSELRAVDWSEFYCYLFYTLL